VERTALRNLRGQVAALVRRAEAGETIVVTVHGREVAQLGPARRDPWRTWAEVQNIFARPVDTDCVADRDSVNQIIEDPFDERSRTPSRQRRHRSQPPE